MDSFLERCLFAIGSVFDTIWFKSILAALAVLFHMEWILVVGVHVMVTIDMLTGVRAAFIRKEKITAKTLYRTIPKLFGYALFLMAFVVLGNMIEVKWIGDYAFALIALTEAKSIVENILGQDAATRFIKVITGKLYDGDLSSVINNDQSPADTK